MKQRFLFGWQASATNRRTGDEARDWVVDVALKYGARINPEGVESVIHNARQRATTAAAARQ